MNVKTKSFRMSRKNLTFKKLDTSSNNSESEAHFISSGLSSFTTSSSSSSSSSLKALKVFNESENLSESTVPTNSSQILQNNP